MKDLNVTNYTSVDFTLENECVANGNCYITT